MEKTLLDENTLFQAVVDQVERLWVKFPNLWNVCSRDDIVSDTFYDLYTIPKGKDKTRISSSIETYGAENLPILVYMLVKSNLQHRARMYYKGSPSTINPEKVKFNKAVSLSTPIDDESSTELIDTIPTGYSLEQEVDYKILYENLPDRYYERYEVRDGCMCNVISYHLIIEYLLNGYTINQISDKVYRKGTNSKVHCQIIYNIVNSLRKDVQNYLETAGVCVQGYRHAINK